MSQKLELMPVASAIAGTEPVYGIQSGLDVQFLWSQVATYFRGLLNVFSKNQSVTFVALTSGATVNTDASLSNNFYLLQATNSMLANPTNLTDGMVLNWLVKQSGAGNTMAFGSKFKFAGGAPTITATDGALDLISGVYKESLDIIVCGIAQDLS
jgi:hypothetical protein